MTRLALLPTNWIKAVVPNAPFLNPVLELESVTVTILALVMMLTGGLTALANNALLVKMARYALAKVSVGVMGPVPVTLFTVMKTVVVKNVVVSLDLVKTMESVVAMETVLAMKVGPPLSLLNLTVVALPPALTTALEMVFANVEFVIVTHCLPLSLIAPARIVNNPLALLINNVAVMASALVPLASMETTVPLNHLVVKRPSAKSVSIPPTVDGVMAPIFVKTNTSWTNVQFLTERTLAGSNSWQNALLLLLEKKMSFLKINQVFLLQPL